MLSQLNTLKVECAFKKHTDANGSAGVVKSAGKTGLVRLLYVGFGVYSKLQVQPGRNPW